MSPPPISPAPYAGPTSLTTSRYASSQPRKPQTVIDSAIATKQQIAVANSLSAPNAGAHNPNAQLAIELGNALKKEVDTHSAKYSSAVSAAIVNTRKLLDLIRMSTPTAELETVDQLWVELEKLFIVANDAKAALPEFLEKQRNNMALYHGTVLNETIHESQEELNLQHKKINLQHNLIIEQQQAFQDLKTQNSTELQEKNDRHDHVSRFTLEKGNFRTEIDKYQLRMDQEAYDKADELKKSADLQRELELITVSKNTLQEENDALRTTKDDLTKKLSMVEQTITEKFTTELKLKAEEVQEESAKSATLNTLVNTLRASEATATKEADKSKAEYKLIREKYNEQRTAHSNAFSKVKELSKQVDSLTDSSEHLRRENKSLKDQLHKIGDLEGEVNKLLQSKLGISKQVDTMALELRSAKEDAAQAKSAFADLSEKSKATERTSSHGDSMRAQDEATIKLLETQNIKLETHIKQLQARVVANPSATISGESKALEDRIKQLEKQNIKLEETSQGWNELATKTYKEYKDMLPVYKQADKIRQDSLNKDAQINELTRQLASATVVQSNVTGSDDSKYWKHKYESLLANLG